MALTQAQRTAEADAITTAFVLALNQIGAGAIRNALATWHGEVPASGAPGAQARWLGRAARQVMQQRAQAAALAIAYYRLVRALRTG